MKTISTFLLIILCTVALLGQQNAKITGTILDEETKQPLVGANIVLEGTSIGVSSTNDGSFVLENIPAGPYNLVASFVGYQTKRLPVDVIGGQMLSVSVALSPSAIPLPLVIVTALTAKKRETPVTFSDISLREIQYRYTVQDVPALLSELPSVVHYSWNGNDLGYTFLSLRGFDQRRISVMINGIPQNDPEDHQVYWIDMPDLFGSTQSVQVQRGAGSAFYGPPAIGGSINIVTTPFTGQPKISMTAGWGFQEFGGEKKTSLNTRKYALAVSSGLINNRYAFYGNLATITSEGYRKQSWVDFKSYFLGAARFDENMTTRVHLFGGPIADGLSYVGLPKYFNEDKNLRRKNYSFWEFDSTGNRIGYVVPQKPQTIENFFQPHYELLHEWKLSPTVTLHNALFYVRGDGFFDYDGDWIWFDPAGSKWFHTVVGYDATFGVSKFPSLILRGFVGNKQWGWLPRLELEHERGRLTIGGELRIHRSVHWGKIQFASELPSSTYDPDFHFYEYNGGKDILSAYGRELYRLDDATTVMADLQLVYNRYGIHNEKFLGNDFDISYVFVNPRIGMNRNFSDRWNGYVSLGYTSREPRLRNLYAAEDVWFGAKPEFETATVGNGSRYQFDKPLAKPEHLLDIELGSSYLFERGSITANLYWMEFQDELIKSGKIDVFGSSILFNAQRTRHVGVELEGRVRLTEELEVSGNATLSSNRIIKHNLFDPQANVRRTLDDNPTAGFPDVLSNARVEYRQGGLLLSLLVKYVGKFHTDNLNDPQNTVDAFTVADLDASWKIPRSLLGTEVRLLGKVRNLFNKLYLASGEGSAFFPAAERNYFVGLNVTL